MNDAYRPSLKIGTVLNDKWIILEFIGKGGMGEVYCAHQSNLKRDVAIKVISRKWLQSLAFRRAACLAAYSPAGPAPRMITS